MPLVDVGLFLYPFAARVWDQPYARGDKFGVHVWNLLTSTQKKRLRCWRE